jgi:hypothetical protein
VNPTGICLDLTKACDVLNHKVLLSKLNSYGIRGMTNLWVESYLSHQKQYLEINSIKQGTCLDYKGNCTWCATGFNSWSNIVFVIHK